MAAPFLEEWRSYLRDNFALYGMLPEAQRVVLEQKMQVFLAEKVFVGCDGFEVTDQVRVLVAAQACLLIIGRDSDFYPGFESILMYPAAYSAEISERDGDVVIDAASHRAGESWHRGPLVLAWDEVLQGGRDRRDGHNVVMHEFAHKLDEENGRVDGFPKFARSARYREWGQVLGREFERMQERGDRVIDQYGATSPAEFFAVVTEVFFEKPGQLQRYHPSLFQQFRDYYQVDPLLWEREGEAA